MSKVCKNCNAVVDDDSRFCIQCGSNEFIVSEAPQQDYAPVPKKKSNKKLFALIGGAIAVVLVAVLLFVFLGGKSYENAINVMLEARYEGNFDNIDELIPEFVLEKKGIEIDDLRERIEEDWQENKYYIYKSYGEDFEVTMEVLMEKEVPEKNLKKAAKFLNEWYGVEEDDVSKAYEVICLLTIEGEKAVDAASIEMEVIKIDGDWYLAEFSDDYEVSFFS